MGAPMDGFGRLRVQGLVKGAVDMDGPRSPYRGHVIQCGDGFRFSMGGPLEGGPNVGIVYPLLDQRLAFPLVCSTGRSVRCQADERQSHSVGLCQGRAVVEGGCAAGARDRHRTAQREGHAQGVVGSGPFIQGNHTRDTSRFEGLHQGRVAGAGTDDGAPQATGDEPLDEEPS